MEIKTIDGKDYLVSSVQIGKQCLIETDKLFDDMWEFIELLREYNKSDFVGDGYGANIEHIYRKYNTDYFSPTFLKSFTENQFGCLAHDIYNTGESNVRGINFHKVMELYYQLPKGERTREKAIELTKEVCADDDSYEKVLEYVNYYFNRHLDYLGGKLDDNSLECLTEHKGKCEIFVKSLGKKLPMKMKYIIDRLDYRDDKIYLIDYKTGSPTADKCNSFDGYLPQMTLYRWAIENEFDMEISATYLNIPKKIKDFYVKINRSDRIDEVVFNMCERFYRNYEKFKKDRLLKTKPVSWCDNPEEKNVINTMAYGEVGTEVEILVPLGETNDDIKNFIIG